MFTFFLCPLLSHLFSDPNIKLAPTLCVDKDGDLDPPRKVQKSEAKESKETNDAIYIAHKSATPLKDVGFQVPFYNFLYISPFYLYFVYIRYGGDLCY